MQINVAQLLKEHAGATREHILREDIRNLDPDVVPLTDLVGRVQLIRTANGVLTTGTLQTSVELECSRCLTLFSKPVKFHLEEEFRPMLDIVTGASLPLSSDDEDATQIDPHHILDLTEIVRQDILLAVPPFPVCRNGCKGLCSICGQNWNEGNCDCTQDELDPRLQVLKQLLEE